MKAAVEILQNIAAGDKKALARCITLVENELEGYEELLSTLKTNTRIPVIGVTGPPGAGKSTLINSIIAQLSKQGKKTGIIAVDPTSPFSHGSLLGDRLRMSEHFTDENVFIRSLATRGALGGLSAKAIEITDVMRSFPFDYIIIETVGVGQSEVEIAGLADTVILVLVPESGDEVQTAKSGIMEIADIYVVNKADREGSDLFAKNILELLHSKKAGGWKIPVIKTVATKAEGVHEIIESVTQHQQHKTSERKLFLLTEKAYHLIQAKRMKEVSKKTLTEKIAAEMKSGKFNLYDFVRKNE